MLLIGSRALALRAPVALGGRAPKDFDFVCTPHELAQWVERRLPDKVEVLRDDKVVAHIGGTICEFEVARDPESSAGRLIGLVEADGGTKETSLGLLPSLDVLFTLKHSHRHLKNSPHFWKNLFDYHRMKDLGAKLVHTDWLKQREKETYTYAHPRLNQDKKAFFADDNIKYVYDHDSIHEAVARGDRPAYRSFQKDGAEVQSDKAKFFACDRTVQINSVLEESAVLAIERSLVPYPGVLTTKQAWHFAFSKVCTSIASGWWRAFAYDNAIEILKAFRDDYWQRFERGLAAGVVKRAA